MSNHEDAFDPYYTWLGIPPALQPPDLYRLVGVSLFETNSEVIQTRADQQMQCVKAYQSGARWAESQKLLNELAAAKICLLNQKSRLEYDRTLRKSASTKHRQSPSAASIPPATDRPSSSPRHTDMPIHVKRFVPGSTTRMPFYIPLPVVIATGTLGMLLLLTAIAQLVSRVFALFRF